MVNLLMTHPSPTNALPIQTQYHHEASYLSPWHTWIWRHNDVIIGHDEFCESKPYSPCQPIYFCLKLFKLPLKLSPDDSPFMTSHLWLIACFFVFENRRLMLAKLIEEVFEWWLMVWWVINARGLNRKEKFLF